MDGEDEDEESEEQDAQCDAEMFSLVAKILYKRRSRFAESALRADPGASRSTQIRGIQWLWDRRRAKPQTQARSVQEAMSRAYCCLQMLQEQIVRRDDWRMGGCIIRDNVGGNV
jgi:hypothetical protein